MIKKSLVFTLIFITSFNSLSQDPVFTQPLTGNINLNTALTGNDTVARFAANYRNQWTGSFAGYITSSVNFYQYISKLNAYGGINFLNDNAGNVFYSKTLSLFYSQNIKIGNALVRPSIEIGFGRKSIDWSKVTFGEPNDPIASIERKDANYADLNTGVIIYYKNILFGVSAHHLTQPNVSVFVGGNSPLPIRYSAQFSYNFTLFNKLRIAPFAFYNSQYGFQSIVGGIDLLYNKHINFAFSVRSQDAVIFNAGYQNKLFSINYSYDVTVSKLTNASTGGTHEIGLAVKFWKVKAHPRFIGVNSVY